MFLVTISNFLANTKIFKNTEVVFSTLSEVGGKSQLVISHPLLTPGTTCLQGEQIVTSLCQDSPAIYGAAIFFDSQLIKESGLENDVSAWCLFNSTPAHPIPQEWIENRNERRNLPLQYMERVFTSISQQAALFRFSIIKTLVLKKR
ncbi:uncharacterized protein LOC112685710 [Sipha flava]|nr:uncharacterized protein LOC112685710 [Sipha flava]